MNKSELKKALKEANFPQHVYTLNGGLPNEQFCLSEDNGKWFVYYSERGNKSGLKTFDNEEDACIYFFQDIIKYY